jgi:hypothetical protein
MRINAVSAFGVTSPTCESDLFPTHSFGRYMFKREIPGHGIFPRKAILTQWAEAKVSQLVLIDSLRRFSPPLKKATRLRARLFIVSTDRET